MHPIIALYSRAYLTAALQDFPAERHWQGDETHGECPAVPSPPPKQRLLARAAAWLRTEWHALREANENDREQIYWPPDL
jgi:hypothetical protein